ncbi:MAG: hypothetical protein ACI9LM_003797 [Alteromonadaceae bacterium]|jgi:hypothetical protein
MESIFKTYYREHPTLLLTFCYLIITLIGVIYSVFFYLEFDIYILKFSDISDFLLASILEPLSITIFISFIILHFISFKIDLWLRNRFQFYGNFISKRLKPKYSDPIIFIVVLMVGTTFFVRDLAINNALNIKNKVKDEYIVLVPNYEKPLTEQVLALLGSSSRFAYFYNHENGEALVIPLESISYMRKKVSVSRVVKEVSTK